MLRFTSTLFGVVFLLALVPAYGQDFQKGLDAARNGDYATALRELRPLAEQGHAIAQYNLGVMYEFGHGVAQDYAEAVKWWRLAAEQCHAHPRGRGDGNGGRTGARRLKRVDPELGIQVPG